MIPTLLTELEQAQAENAELRERLIDTTASLVAAVSLLERGGKSAKKAAPSDKMFDQMLDDYRGAIGRSRTALQEDTSHE